MDKFITHFMWGYQQNFRHSVEISTKRILDTLKPGLIPTVFLIGVRVGEGQSDNQSAFPACVEPETHHWAQSAEFYDVLGDVESIQAAYPESRMRQSHPIAQERQDTGLFRRALREAVLRRLESCPNRPPGIRVFASMPVERGDFLVFTLITVISSVFDELPAASGNTIKIHEYRSFQVPCNLIEAAIEEIHERANAEILKPDAGASLFFLGSSDQLIRQAGLRFFVGLLNRVDQDSLMIGAAPSVFDAISRLSLAPYESAEPKGTLLFAEHGMSIGTPDVTLAEPSPLHHARTLRKLLVLANDGLYLRCNCDNVYGLVRVPESPQSEAHAGIIVRITGRGKWSACVDDRILMTMSDGQPGLPKPEVDEADIARDLRRVFHEMTEEMAACLARIGRHLAVSGHGGIVVVSGDAVNEAIRLGNGCLPISPMKLTPELAAKLTEIDGAVLCDPDGSCHAIGVILDGTASKAGDRGRGSRFNSAVRYINSSQAVSVAMVVSEDGGLDFVPRLRPTLARAALESRLRELELLALSPSTPPDREREIDVIDWIEENDFYLSDTQCESANGWIAECETRFSENSNVRITRRRLKPDPAFDPARDLS